ncbi:MAG: TldD/PmbA family protein [Clostridia bacterium]|nr:TldD/PmbA family protein [Clostridia bacterium]
MNEYKALIEKLFEQAKDKGITEMEAYFREGESFSVNVFKGSIEDYKLSTSMGLGFRGFYHGKIGYSYTEKVAEDSIESLIRDVIGNASVNDNEDDDVIFEGAEEYQEVITYNEKLDEVTEKAKIDFAMEMDSKAYAHDSRVKVCQACVFSSGTSNTILMNNKGLYLSEKSNGASSYIVVTAADGEEMSTGVDFMVSNDFTRYNAVKMAHKAVEEATRMLHAKPVKTGEYKIVLDPVVSADMLSTIQSMFSARAVQKGVSMLKGKLNSKVASVCVTIVDDPFLKDGMGSASFDGEGVPTKFKKLIENGVLTTYLYNLKTAKKDGVTTTGNASRESYKSTIGIAPSNLYIQKGEKTFEEVIAYVGDGLYLTDLDGMHSGFNTISGDFSLGAKGFIIENGVLSRPVNQITVSGNYFDVMKKIEMVGSDLKFTFGSVGSPSIVIESLPVTGV